MNNDIYERNKNIYIQCSHFGKDKEIVANMYKLSVSTVKSIIEEFTKLEAEGIEFLDKLQDFLLKNYNTSKCQRTRACNSLSRYFGYKTVITKKEIIESIQNDNIYIRGVGEETRAILKEYIGIENSKYDYNKVIHEFNKINSSLNKLQKIFNDAQIKELLIGFREDKLSLDKILIYADPKFNWKQMREIRYGISLNNLTSEQISIFAKEEYDSDQMYQIRLGLEENLPIELYSNPEYNYLQMSEIRWALKGGLSEDQIKKYADPNNNYEYMRKMYDSLLKK